MTIFQHYYTSCEGKGFQTNAFTEGLDSDTIRFLERNGVYIPPVSMPSRPTEEELKDFPVSLSYLLLPNQRSVVINSVYVGKDYSGRFGNYFSHALVTDNYEKDIGSLLPILFWDSQIWTTKESKSSELPPLERVEIGSSINWDNVYNFLNEDNRLSFLPNLLTATLEGLKTKKRIVIVDSNLNIAMWIAAITFTLPYGLARQVTFTTYNKNPYMVEVLICGTTSDSEFHFSAQEINYEYFVFDFENNRSSEIKETNPYTKLVIETIENGDFKLFDDFSEFYYEIVSLAPESSYELFDLFAMYSVSKGKSISEADWEKVIQLITSYNLINLNPNKTEVVIEKLSEVSFWGKSLVDYVIGLCEKANQENVTKSIKEKTAKSFFNIVLWNYAPNVGANDLEDILDKSKNINLELLQTEDYEIRCLKLFQNAEDVKKKITLFRLLKKAKLITPKSTILENLLDDEIIPTITEYITQQLFLEMMNTDFRPYFIKSLGEVLLYKYTSQEADIRINDISNLISDDNIYNDLVSFAIQHRRVDLYKD
ncbi:MAG: hypothetical protein ACOC80_12240, partial [Petrotogales bacterium]